MGLLNWRGDKIADEMLEAAALGIDQTTEAMVEQGKANHEWSNVTGVLEGSTQMRPAKIQGKTAVGEFGSYGVDYGEYIELGTSKMPARPWLRPAFDAEAPNLAGRIKGAA